MSASTAPLDAPGRTGRDVTPPDLARRITTWSLVLFLGTRALLIAVAELPEITPDEPGSWAVAKWLSGTAGTIHMGDMPRYPLVPGAVLAPLWWIPIGPGVRYQLGLVVLTALTVLAAVLVRRTLRMLGADETLAAAGLALVLLVPATTFSGAFTWAEPTVLLWWSLLFWGVVGCERSTRPTTALAVTSVVAGLAPFVHGRLAAVPLLWCAYLAVRFVTRTTPAGPGRAPLALGAFVTVAVAAAALVVNRAVGDALWSAAEPALKGDGPLAWLSDPTYWVTLLIEGAGQLVYVLLSTAGLALAGAALLVRMVWRPSRPGERLIGLTLGLMLASNLVISTVVMAGFLHESDFRAGRLLTAPRWDHMVYGRYNDAAAVVLATLGIVWFGQLARRRDALRLGAWGVALVVACAVPVGVRMSGLELTGRFPTPNAAGLTIVPFAGDGPAMLLWALTAAALVGAVAWAASRGRRTFLVVVGAWLLVAGCIGMYQAGQSQRYGFLVDLAEDVGPPATPARGFLVPSDTNVERYVRMSVYQAQLGLVDQGWRTSLVEGTSEEVAAAPGDAGALLLMEGIEPEGDGWQVVDTYGRVVVWRRG